MCWGTLPNPEYADDKIIEGSGEGSFECSITNLVPGTTYYFKTFAKLEPDNQKVYSPGSGTQITTIQLGTPDVETVLIEDVTHFSAKIKGNVISDGGSDLTTVGLCYGLSKDLTVDNSQLVNLPDPALGEFELSLSNLSASTTYYVRAYATNSVGTEYGAELDFTTGIEDIFGELVDNRPEQPQVYKTVRIGEQVWMAENLRYVRPGGGSECYNPANDLCDEYGQLYSWPAAMDIDDSYLESDWEGLDGLHQGICPEDWHLPSDEEWQTLEAHLLMGEFQLEHWGQRTTGNVGFKLKTIEGWDANGQGSDEVSFAAKPAGFKNGTRENPLKQGSFTGFWTSTQEDNTQAIDRTLTSESKGISRMIISKRTLYSVRCIKDQE